MKLSSITNNKVKITVGTLILTALIILWEYFNSGVKTHHLFGNDDLPGISNWWNLLTIPALTWVIISLIEKRQRNLKKLNQKIENDASKILKRFFGALIFGILISILWKYRLESVIQYIILFPIVISLFRPVHFPECLIGLVLGMLYTFGGILPIIVGIVLIVLSFVSNKIIRKGVLLIASKLN